MAAEGHSNMTNISSIRSSYSSLSTDFDSYVASQPTAAHGSGANIWSSSSGVRSGNFDLTLGGTYLLDGVAFWNLGAGDPSSIQHFNITLSNDSLFAVSTTYTGFTASNSLGTSTSSGVQTFGFTPTLASFVRVYVLDTWSASSFGTGFNEIALRASPTPEPSTTLLCGLVFLGSSASRRFRAKIMRCS
jgi:hypothetical protein